MCQLTLRSTQYNEDVCADLHQRTLAVKMRGIFASCALLLAAAWADHHHHHHHGSEHSHDELNCHVLLSPNADFAFSLFKTLNTKTAAGKNIFFSPLGISTALSVLSTGACGETHSQLFSSLGYSTLNQTQVNDAYKHLFDMHGNSQDNQQLDVGNAVALRSGFSPLEKFLKDVQHYYSAEVFNVNITDPAEAVAHINAFIANQTHDKITDMVKDLGPDMAMMLINYVHFKGEWQEPFDPFMTRKLDFHVNKTTTVKADMMFRRGYYDVYWDVDNHTIVTLLPYKGNNNDTSMMIVLPKPGKMEEVEGFINKDYIKHWHESVFKKWVSLELPKFSISTENALEDTLKEMGITNAFTDDADFSGLSDSKLKVSKVSHKAMLSVAELGTEEADVNIYEDVYAGFPRAVNMNRPFFIFILENSSKSILFMGKINNPTAV